MRAFIDIVAQRCASLLAVGISESRFEGPASAWPALAMCGAREEGYQPITRREASTWS